MIDRAIEIERCWKRVNQHRRKIDIVDDPGNFLIGCNNLINEGSSRFRSHTGKNAYHLQTSTVIMEPCGVLKEPCAIGHRLRWFKQDDFIGFIGKA